MGIIIVLCMFGGNSKNEKIIEDNSVHNNIVETINTSNVTTSDAEDNKISEEVHDVEIEEPKNSYSSESSNSNKNITTVYITKSGSKYHRSGCSYLKKSKISISKDDAIGRGLESCSKCKP